MKKKEGRPTKFRKKYCKMIEDFFKQPANRQVVKKEIIKSNGTIEREYTTLPNALPTVSKFADLINVNPDTIHEWSKSKKKNGKPKYPEFSESYNKAMGYAQDFLVENGLAGLSPPASFIFVAKNYTGMKDKQEVDLSTKGEKISGFNYIVPKDAKSDTNNSAVS